MQEFCQEMGNMAGHWPVESIVPLYGITRDEAPMQKASRKPASDSARGHATVDQSEPLEARTYNLESCLEIRTFLRDGRWPMIEQ